MTQKIVYLRDVDGTGSLHPCSKDDPNAIEYAPCADIDSIRQAALEVFRNYEGHKFNNHTSHPLNWLGKALRLF